MKLILIVFLLFSGIALIKGTNLKGKKETTNNQCYLNGYKNLEKNIIGTGDYEQCVKVVQKIVNKDKKKGKIKIDKNDKKNIILREKEFSEVISYFLLYEKQETIKVLDLKNKTKNLFKLNFDEFSSLHSTSTKYDNISLKLVYLETEIDKFLNDNKMTSIDTSTISIDFKKSNTKKTLTSKGIFEQIPLHLFIILIIFASLYLVLFFILRNKTIFFFFKQLFYFSRTESKVANEIIYRMDNIILSPPVKHIFLRYLFQNKKDELGNGSYDIETYKALFQMEIQNKNITVMNAATTTFKHRQVLKAKIFTGFVALVNLIIILTLSIVIVCHIEQAWTNKVFIYVISSYTGFIVIIAIMEILYFISSLDKIKNYYLNKVPTPLVNILNSEINS